MSDWWTYRPADLLMFSPETYYRLFELYNEALWPAQLAALAAGLAIFVLLLRGPRWCGRVIAGLLAACWVAVAWGYFDRYATINLAAPFFAWGFAVQAGLLAVIGGAMGRLTFEEAMMPPRRAGIALFVFALLLQPLIAPLTGRAWLSAEVFGLAPDPTVLATLGVLLAADRVRWALIVLPVLWCAVTGATLWTMGAPEALLLPLAGLLAVGVAAHRSLHSAWA